jgi:hypothetical protein
VNRRELNEIKALELKKYDNKFNFKSQFLAKNRIAEIIPFHTLFNISSLLYPEALALQTEVNPTKL